MQIIIDKRLPVEAKDKLSVYGELIELSTSGITYDAISGHPDIFFCKLGKHLVASPNLPDVYKQILNERDIPIIYGVNPVNEMYPESASYNAVVSNSFLIHRVDITDPAIMTNADHLEKIDVTQGYCRCNLLPLGDDQFITSDKGIHKVLNKRGLNCLYVSPEKIMLKGFSHGFFGGACGIHDNRVFIAGSLDLFPDGELVRDYLDSIGFDIVELYKGLLFDGGSILFVDKAN